METKIEKIKLNYLANDMILTPELLVKELKEDLSRLNFLAFFKQGLKHEEKFLEKGLKQVFISMGSEGVFACDEKSEVFLKAKAKDIKSATGAGDAFMAGIISSYLKGSQLDKACSYATGASLTALKSYSTINPAMSESEIEKTLTDIEFEIKLY